MLGVVHVLLLFMYIIMHSNFLIKLGLLYILSLYIVALKFTTVHPSCILS